MRYWLGFLVLGVLAALPMGCAGDEAHPVWGAICNAICDRGDECYNIDVGACNSLCLSELGNVRCKANQPVLDACVEGIGELSCTAVDRGALPEACDDVCLCERVDDCDDGNQCTAGMCDVESGACSFTPVADGVSCVGDVGTCQEGRCVMACTETGIRSAVLAGGGPYAFACDGPTTVTTAGEIVIDRDLILDGGGNLTVDADGRHRVFSVTSELYFPIVELRDLAITGGGETDRGGGIYSFGALTLADCVVSGNAARSEGGGVYSDGPLTILDSTISENTVPQGRGGGIAASDQLTIVRSTISENAGGGLSSGGFATIIDSTIERNTVREGGIERGGAAIVNGFNMTIVGSTVSQNVADDFEGSAIGNLGELTMLNSTVSGNTGSGVRNSGTAAIISSTIAENTSYESRAIHNTGRVTLRNSIVSGGCSEWREVEWVSEGGNLESPGDSCGLNQPTDRVGLTVGELDLGPLQDNGGLTFTHELGSRSPAIDAVPLEDCVDAEGMTLAVDQRGEERPKGSQCDAGAVESDTIQETDFPCNEEGLLEAIDIGGGPHTFDCNGPTTVTTTAEIVIEQAVILDGEGLLTIDGNDNHRIFKVRAAPVELRNLTLTGGRATGGGRDSDGGAIYQDAYRLTLVNTQVWGNHAERWGGALFGSYSGELVLIDSTLSNNTAGSAGGAIFTNIDLNLIRSTVSGNSSGAHGGGIILSGGTTTLTNSTVSGNNASQGGGGIQHSGSELVLNHSTVANNVAPIGSAIINYGPLTAWNTILEGVCSLEGGTVTSEGGNLESPGNTCGLNVSIGDLVGVSTQALNLGSLQDNGGPTLTHLPGSESSAIDVIESNDCPEATDQRGVARPQGPLCDVGAVEVE